MDSNHLIVLAIGLVGSLTIHLSQGLLKLAILRRSEERGGRNNRALYGLGLILNFSAPLWVIVANRFGPTVLYTSMYATGLLGLILFSCWKLNRPLRTAEIFGAILVIVGSAIVVLGYTRAGITGMEATAPGWLLGGGLAPGAHTPARRAAGGALAGTPDGARHGGFRWRFSRSRLAPQRRGPGRGRCGWLYTRFRPRMDAVRDQLSGCRRCARNNPVGTRQTPTAHRNHCRLRRSLCGTPRSDSTRRSGSGRRAGPDQLDRPHHDTGRPHLHWTGQSTD